VLLHILHTTERCRYILLKSCFSVKKGIKRGNPPIFWKKTPNSRCFSHEKFVENPPLVVIEVLDKMMIVLIMLFCISNDIIFMQTKQLDGFMNDRFDSKRDS
jgi:hypothetical protein